MAFTLASPPPQMVNIIQNKVIVLLLLAMPATNAKLTFDCTNTCEWPKVGAANNGQCEDGGAGAVNATCDLGTDCDDCGPREPELAGGLVLSLSLSSLAWRPPSHGDPIARKGSVNFRRQFCGSREHDAAPVQVDR